MGNINVQLESQSTEDEDPFRYGYRTVTQVDEHGTKVRVTLPLSREDLLHPHENDEIVSNPNHDRDVAYLRSVVRQTIGESADRLVLSDVNIDWDIPGMKALRPDIVLFADPGEPITSLKGTYYPARVGARTRLIIEVTSPSDPENDLKAKVELNHRAKVPFYAIVDYDPVADSCLAKVFGYRYTPTGYARVDPDHRGWLWLEALWLWLTWEDGKVICYEADCRPVLEVGALRTAHDAFESRCNDLEQQAEEAIIARANALAQVRRSDQARAAAEARIAELLAELARVKGT